MKINKWFLTFGLVIFTLSIAQAEDSPGGGSKQSLSTPGQGHRNVIGTISKTTENMITLETEEGTTRNFTVKSAKIDGVTKIQPGDRVLLELDEGNQIIGINSINDKHQMAHGEVVGLDRARKIITIKLKNSTLQSYGMKEAMAGKMNNIPKGTMITLMVDQHNNLAMDVHVD